VNPTRHSASAAADGEAAFECPLCGIVAASSPLPCGCGRAAALAALPYSVANKFRVQRRIGSGGMGVVYLAREEVLDRDVALKTLPCLRPRAVERLRDEARSMAALNHESLATLYGLEIWRGTPILVVEFFPNGTLASRLCRGPLFPREAVALGIRLARALVYMQARAVLHRDLKPSNIAFTASGDVKLLDFGLATLSSPDVDNAPSDRGGTRGEPFVGTRGYASPETLRGEPSSPSGDRWALAVVLVEAACGVNPFAAKHRGAARGGVVRTDLPAACSARLSEVPELRAFLERALAPSPEDRFHTSGEFLDRLQDVAAALESRAARGR
jgi:serine/threonine protein kinase